jgi:hypothetical protein
MEPLNWSDIYRVSHERRLPTNAEIDTIQGPCGQFPDGYVEFIRDFGFGELDGIRILQPEHVSGQADFLREQLAEWCSFCEEFDEPIIIPPGVVDDAAPLAGTDWGEFCFCSPSDPGVLWHMPCSHDWDSKPAILLYGFRNPFVQQVPGEEPEEVAKGPLVFDPDRDVFSRQICVTGPDVIADDSETLATLVRAVHTRLEVNKVVTHDAHVTSAYVIAWGGEIRTGYRHQDSNYFLYMKVDAGHKQDCDALLGSLTEQGYVLETVW